MNSANQKELYGFTIEADSSQKTYWIKLSGVTVAKIAKLRSKYYFLEAGGLSRVPKCGYKALRDAVQWASENPRTSQACRITNLKRGQAIIIRRDGDSIYTAERTDDKTVLFFRRYPGGSELLSEVVA